MPQKYEHAFKTENGKWIFVPTKESRETGYKILKEIKSYWGAPDYFYHLQPGGHLAAIKRHENKKYFIRADIKNFFPSISRNKIVRSLQKTGIYFKRAKDIADLSTVISKDNYRRKILPFGFIQSPTLASIALDMSALGNFLRQTPQTCEMSVYADDILYSSNDEEHLEEIHSALKKSFLHSGFPLNEEKSHGPQNLTTAFNIDLEENLLKINDTRYADFKNEMHNQNRLRARAIAQYVRGVNQNQYNELVDIYEAAETLSLQT